MFGKPSTGLRTLVKFCSEVWWSIIWFYQYVLEDTAAWPILFFLCYSILAVCLAICFVWVELTRLISSCLSLSWPQSLPARCCVFRQFSRGRWGIVDAFLHFQPLLLRLKSKQTQNLAHNKATLFTQYHAEIWKQHLSEKMSNRFIKYTFSVECAPCLGHTWHEHGVHLTGQ